MSNIHTEIQPESKHYRCRHIFTDGHRCGSKSLRGEQFCYFHHTSRQPAFHRHADVLPNRRATFDLPLFEDRAAIQSSIYEVARRIATRQIDSRRAALLLYAMQIALQTHPPLPAAAPASATDVVDDIILHPTLGRIAPEAEFVVPERQKSDAQLLMEAWEREP